MQFAKWLYMIPLRVRSVFRRSDVEQELEEELRYHVEQQTAANIAKGWAPEDARHEALCALHGVEQRKEECRDARGVDAIENLVRDLRYAARMMRKNPAFTVVAVLSLALGIGANTAIFGLIDTLLLRPLPVPHPEQLRTVGLDWHRSRPLFYLTHPMFEALRSRNQIFSHVFAWANHRFQIRSGPDMVHVNGVMASGDYFTTLGIPPIAGRTFNAEDDDPAGGKDGPVAVISDQFWSREFQRAPSAIGSGITLDGVRFTVVGVMPAQFFGAEVAMRPDVWVPLSLDSKIEGGSCLNGRDCWWLVIMGRLKSGVSEREVEERLQAISPLVLQDAGPLGQHARTRGFVGWHFFTAPGARGWTALRLRFSNPLAILMTLVGLVLLIACANMANLLLARASARQREIAVRLSIGASRSRIMQQLLTESVMLSAVGAAAGSLFAIWLTRFLVAFLQSKQQFGPTAEMRLQVHADWRVALFTLTIAIGSGILFGFAPALRATRTGTASALKEGAHQLRGGERRVGIGQLILPLQAALSVLLVAAAGLFAGSLYHLLTLNFGFDPRDVTLIAINTDRLQTKDAAKLSMYRTLLERVNTMPGVQAASLLWFTPLSGAGWDDLLSIPGKNDVSEQDRDTYINPVGTRYFEVMKIPLLAGRPFEDQDTAASEKVGIINVLAAQRFFPNHNAIGSHVVLEQKVIRIVGVAGNVKYLNLRNVDPPEMYIPYTQQTGIPSLTFAIKTGSNAQAIYPEFRAALRQIAPGVPIELTKTMQEQVNESVGSERLMASLSIFFGTLALLLTSIGLYGTLAYTVTRRTGEIGIRMALGARGREVVWLVLRGTIGLVGLGTAVGIAAVIAASRLVRSLLYGVQPNDPGNLILAVCTLFLVAALAAYIPARRASHLDPTVALREE